MAEKQKMNKGTRLFKWFFTRIQCVRFAVGIPASGLSFLAIDWMESKVQKLGSTLNNRIQPIELHQYTKMPFQLFVLRCWHSAMKWGLFKYDFTAAEWLNPKGNCLFLSPPSLLTVRGQNFSLFQMLRKERNFLFA